MEENILPSEVITEHETEKRVRIQKHYNPSIDRFRLKLMFFMCINLFGFPTVFGDYVRTICGFVPLAFFILSGYLVLRDSPDRSGRILRTIKRTALVFAALLVFYTVINLVYYKLRGVDVLPALGRKRFWFNFLVMNVWQFYIGSSIWYVQALLYAYIIIYFLDKWKLLRFDWLIAMILIAFTVVTGELAGLFPWEWQGYNYIPGNFLTRALPYLLLGGFVRRKLKSFTKVYSYVYILGIVLGVVLVPAEVILLGKNEVAGYYGHLIGMPLIALSACMLAIKKGDVASKSLLLQNMSRWHINCIYYFCQPVSMLLAFLLALTNETMVIVSVGFIGIVTYLVCLLLAWLIADIQWKFAYRKEYGEWPPKQKRVKKERQSLKSRIARFRSSFKQGQALDKQRRREKKHSRVPLKEKLARFRRSYREGQRREEEHRRHKRHSRVSLADRFAHFMESYREERLRRKEHRRHKHHGHSHHGDHHHE